MYVYIHIHIYVLCVHTCVYIYIYIHMYTYIYVYIYIYTHTPVSYMYMYIYIYIYIYMHVHMRSCGAIFVEAREEGEHEVGGPETRGHLRHSIGTLTHSLTGARQPESCIGGEFVRVGVIQPRVSRPIPFSSCCRCVCTCSGTVGYSIYDTTTSQTHTFQT